MGEYHLHRSEDRAGRLRLQRLSPRAGRSFPMFGMTSGLGSESCSTTLVWCVVLVGAIAAAIWDLSTGRIPNLLTIPIFLAGLLWSTWHGGGSGLLVAVGSAILLALPCFVLFL